MDLNFDFRTGFLGRENTQILVMNLVYVNTSSVLIIAVVWTFAHHWAKSLWGWNYSKQ